MFRVINSFIDLDSSKKYLIGDEFKPFTPKRGKELVKLGFLEEVKKGKPEKGDSGESESIK